MNYHAGQAASTVMRRAHPTAAQTPTPAVSLLAGALNTRRSATYTIDVSMNNERR
jgi:hypothetical protein